MIDKTKKQFLKDRTIHMSAFYQGDGVDNFYSPERANSKDQYDYSGIASLIDTYSDKYMNVISLGCGDCRIDKMILHKLRESKVVFQFFGVDSSCEMIEKARKNSGLSNFCVGDFMEIDMGHLCRFDRSVFMMIGNTFGNFDQNTIIEKMFSLMKEKDLFLLDIASFHNIDNDVEIKLKERYTSYTYNKANKDFLLRPIKNLGIPVECGDLLVKSSKDEPIVNSPILTPYGSFVSHPKHISHTGASCFDFFFKIQKDTTVNICKTEVSLKEGESIHLHKILVYDIQLLIPFMKENGFKHLGTVMSGFKNQLLFEKA